MLCISRSEKQANSLFHAKCKAFLKAGLGRWMSDSLSCLCVSDSDAFQSPVSTPLKSHRIIPAGFGWSGTRRLLFPLEFGTKEMEFQNVTLNPHILHTGETPGSKPTGKLLWNFFNNLICVPEMKFNSSYESKI